MENKGLKLIDQAGEECLEKFVDKLDHKQLDALKSFIDDVTKTYNAQCKKKEDNNMPGKYYLQYCKSLGDNIEVGCCIRNCIDIEEAAGSIDIIVELSCNGNNIVVRGDGDFGGCTKEEYKEFVHLIFAQIKSHKNKFI